MQRRKKRKREKATTEKEEAAEQPAADQEQAGTEDTMVASDLLAPMQVRGLPPLQQHRMLTYAGCPV
jgi:hypothetical protein